MSIHIRFIEILTHTDQLLKLLVVLFENIENYFINII